MDQYQPGTVIVKDKENGDATRRYMVLCTFTLIAAIVILTWYSATSDHAAAVYPPQTGSGRVEDALLTRIAPIPTNTVTMTPTATRFPTMAPPTPTSLADRACEKVKDGEICTVSYPPEPTKDLFRDCEIVTPIPGQDIYCRKTNTIGTILEQETK